MPRPNAKAKREGQPQGWPSLSVAPDAYCFGPAPGFAGTMVAPSARTLGGLVAVPVGECAPALSSGFCSAGV